MSDLAELIERLEKAEAGSAELDAAVWCACFPESEVYFQHGEAIHEKGGPIAHECELPRLTRSLDAAIALVERALPDVTWDVMRTRKLCQCTLHFPVRYTGTSKYPAVAICIALLRALQAKADQ